MATSSIIQSEMIWILTKDRNFRENWRKICQRLNFDQSIMSTLEKMESVSELTIKILDYWETMSPEDANPITLSKLLGEIGSDKSAGDINAIFGTGLSTPNIQNFHGRSTSQILQATSRQLKSNTKELRPKEINQFEIVTILANDSAFGLEWRLFCRRLDFEQSIMYTLDKTDFSHSPISDITIKIMDHWKSKSPGNANPTTLSNVLRQMGCAKSANEIDALFGTGVYGRKLETDFTNFHVSSTAEVPQVAALPSNSNTTETKLIWLIRPPTIYYSGRNKEMQMIEDHWIKCQEKKTMLFFAITGLGGIGKSELARNYAKRFHQYFKGHCIWIDAETDQKLLQSFQNFAEHELINIPIKDVTGKECPLDVLAKEIYRKLSGKMCLLIFDNVESYDQPIIKLFSNLASSQSPTVLKPLILTTSRYQPALKIFGSKCTQIELGILTDDAAINFFSQYLKVDRSYVDDSISDCLKRLSARLQFYPLAMQQAAAFIEESLPHKTERNNSDVKTKIEDYLEKIEIETKKLLDHPLPEYEEMENKTTYLTWRVTYNKMVGMEEIGVGAIKLIFIISFLSPDNISTEFLLKIFSKNENDNKTSDENQSLEILKNHSMIIMSQNTNLELISIHRLVQEVIRIILNENGILTGCLDDVLTGIQDMLIKNEIPSDQITHAQTIWGHTLRNKQLIEKHGRVPGWICKRLEDSGKYREFYDFSCRSLHALESTVGTSSRWTLKIKYWKGVSLRELGEYSESLDLLNEVYEKQKEIFGVEDEDSIVTANGIGSAHLRIRNYNQAVKWYGDALEIRERLNGKEHLETLNLKNNMAQVLKAQEKFKEAMEIYKEVLKVQEKVLGRDDQSTLTTKQNLATVRYQLKEYENALKIFQDVLEVEKRKLGLDHPSTLNTKGWIANTYECLGRVDEAHQLAKEVYDKLEKVLGSTHPQTITSRNELTRMKATSKNNIVIVLNEQGKYSEAKEMCKEILEVQERVWGKENLGTLNTKQNLACAAFQLKEYEDALSMFQEVLAVQESVLNLDHPDTLVTKGWIADTYECLGSIDEAFQLAKEVDVKMEKVLGQTHPHTIKAKNRIEIVVATKHNLATARYEEKEYEDALKMFLEVLEVEERGLGLYHLSTLNTKEWIVGTYECLGRLEEAYHLAKDVHEKRLNVLGLTHLDTIRAKNRLESLEMRLNT